MTETPRVPAIFGKGRGASLYVFVANFCRSLWAILSRTRPFRAYGQFVNIGGPVLSAGMSYQALFAVFAALWVGFGAFGVLLSSHPAILDALVSLLNQLVPGLVGDGGAVSLHALMEERGFGWTRIIASASLLWLAVSWFTGTRRSIRIIFELEVRQYRNFVLLKLRDFTLAIVFGLAIVASAALTVLGTTLSTGLLDFLGLSAENWLVGTVGTIARWAAIYVFDVLLLIGIHRWLAEIPLGFFTLLRGCALGAVGMLGLKLLGSALLGGTSSNPLLASFTVIIGLLIWFNLLCRLLLLTSSWIATGQNKRLGLPATPPRHSSFLHH